MTWFMTELTVADLAVSRDWYVRVLGFTIALQDPIRPFCLLTRDGQRLAMRESTPVDCTTILHFQTDDFLNEIARIGSEGVRLIDDVKTSDEGYRRAAIHDPDGRKVIIFEWIKV